MGFNITSEDYVKYLRLAAAKIEENGAYITALDAVTGDGDHWANIHKGFSALMQMAPELETKPIDAVFRQIGATMMSKVGGSSGALYGGAYLAASKKVSGKEKLDSPDLCDALEAMVTDMMSRGKAQPGDKTMIDTLYPAVQVYKKAIAQQCSDRETMEMVRDAALQGAQSTEQMEAMKGRASYRQDKGVGHLDPGAVTMAYQITCMADYTIDHVI